MTKLAIRATRALQKENGRRLLAGEEFLTQDEIAELIDQETMLPKLVEALENARASLEVAFNSECDGDVFGVHHNDATDALSGAEVVLAEANNPEVK